MTVLIFMGRSKLNSSIKAVKGSFAGKDRADKANVRDGGDLTENERDERTRTDKKNIQISLKPKLCNKMEDSGRQ